MEATAALSPCRNYRYGLWRTWSDGPQVLFIMLNPSTADETTDDPTIRRCIGFARSWGFGSMAVGNLFALRTPSPDDLIRSTDPLGAENDEWIQRLQKTAALTVAAWGNHGRHLGRGEATRRLLKKPSTLGLTKLAQPRHPLYVHGATQPQPWT